MRFTVHAKHNREPIERRFASVIEATGDAWRLMAAGATDGYIFGDNTGSRNAPARTHEQKRTLRGSRDYSLQ
jgi:hypothetical protein